jgi:hypothetical protein
VVVGVSASALLPAVGVQVVFVDEAGAKQSGALEVLWRTGFEHVLPVRSFGSFQGQRSFQGSWWFATTGEHVGFESWVERDAVMLLDFDPDVVAVSSQPFWLRWAGQPGARRHVPDYFARLADGSAVVIDVRPDELVGADDAEVFAATQRACAGVGWGYRRVGVADAGAGGERALAVGLPASPLRERAGRQRAGAAGGGRPGDGGRSGWVCR